MALDQQLIGFWQRIDKPEYWFHEITPSGKVFLYSVPEPYEISSDGLTLSITAPREVEVYQREGDPATSLLGTWTRSHPTLPLERLTYNPDGTYLIQWDEIYWGYYEDLGDSIRENEFRGTMSTYGDQLTQVYQGISDTNQYGFDGADIYRYFNPDGTVKSVYQRHTP